MNAADIYQSSEFKKLHECALKQCPKIGDNLKKQMALVGEIDTLSKEIKMHPSIDKSVIMLKKVNELAALLSKKDQLVCKMQNCSDEFIKLQQHSVNVATKMSKKAIAVLEKMQKKK